MRREKRGFTLTEVIVTVGILVVLLGLAIPTVLTIQRSLEMTRLDHNAREIFLAAQNSLTERRSAGTLDQIRDVQPDLEAEHCAWMIWDPESGEEGPTQILPPNAIEDELWAHPFAIFYNTTSGTALEVYCSEGTLPEPGDLRRTYGPDPDLRKKDRIGFYSGDDLELNGLIQLHPAILRVENSNELTLTVHVPANAVNQAGTLSTMTVTLTELDSAGQPKVKRNSLGKPVHGQLVLAEEKNLLLPGPFVYTLDSLFHDDQNKEIRFSEVTKGKLTPGADVEVEVRLEKTSADPKNHQAYQPSVVRTTFNSLFASREEDTAVLSCARHLQNLDQGWSAVSGITAARQQEDMNWPSAPDRWPEEAEPWPAGKTPGLFRSIENTELRSFDGGSFEIRDLTGPGGLFGPISQMELKGIRLTDPVIGIQEGEQNSSALSGVRGDLGALTNSTKAGTVIEDCRVYASSHKGQLDKPPAHLGIHGTNQLASQVGGLVGYAENTTIRGSFAALPHISGGLVGGLIGRAKEGVTLTGCYAATGIHREADGLWSWNDGLRGKAEQSMAGGLVGQSLAPVGITDCYAVGYAEAETVSPLCGGQAYINSSYWLMDRKEGGQLCGYQLTSGGPAFTVTVEELKTLQLPHFAPMTGGETWPYSKGNLGNYPYPALKNGEGLMPHYGDWPTRSDVELKLLDTEGKELEFLLVPVGQTAGGDGPAAVHAVLQAVSGEKITPLELKPEQIRQKDSASLSEVTTTYDPDTGKNTLTLTGNRAGTTGVTWMDLETDRGTLRVPLVLYTAELTLTGTPVDGKTTGPVNNTATVLEPQADAVIHTLKLDTGRQADFQASLQVSPSAEDALSGLASVRTQAATDKVATCLTSDEPLRAEDWLGFQVEAPDAPGTMNTGPGVSANPPVPGVEGVFTLRGEGTSQYPHAPAPTETAAGSSRSSGTLSIWGQSAGTGRVSVSWAMDRTLEVSCPVRVSGAQVVIRSAAGSGERSGVLGQNDQYPYILSLQPLPGEAVTLTLDARLFGSVPQGVTGSYKWSITRNGETVCEEVRNDQHLEVTLPVDDGTADYRVQVVYSYTDSHGPYTTADFMNLRIRRQTLKTDTLGSIQIYREQDHGPADPMMSTEEPLVLEQVPGLGDTYNRAILSGRVAGAEDSHVVWYLKNADGRRTRLSGGGTVQAEDDQGYPIAELTWGSAEHPVTGDADWRSRGGHLEVQALDREWYGPGDLSFTLIAEARDSGRNDAPQSREIKVQIRPKLEIDPRSKVVSGFHGQVDDIKFTANRDDAIYPYIWNVDPKNGTEHTQEKKHELIFSTTDPGEIAQIRDYRVTLSYGPYEMTANLTAKGWANTTQFDINHDEELNGRNVFLVEKGETRRLELSWGSSMVVKYSIKQEPQSSQQATVSPIPGGYVAHDTLLGSYRAKSYDVTGLEFTSAPMALNWTMTPWPINGHPSFDLYVVGGEFESHEPVRLKVSDFDSQTPRVLNYTSSFPEGLGTGTVTLSFSQPGIVRVDGADAGTGPDGQQIYTFKPAGENIDTRQLQLTGLKYGSTVMTAVYKVVCTEGVYEYRDSVVLRVEPPVNTFQAQLVPCTAADRTVLTELFREDKELADSSCPVVTWGEYAVADTGSGGDRPVPPAQQECGSDLYPTLLADAPFAEKGYHTLYLKARVTGKGGPVNDPTHFLQNFYSDKADVAAVSWHSRSLDGGGEEYYLKITASGNVSQGGELVTITADFGGGLTATVPVQVFGSPRVEITRLIPDDSGSAAEHTLIQGYDGTVSDYTFGGRLVPRLVGLDAQGTCVPLDHLVWKPVYPGDDYGGLSLTETEDGSGSHVHIAYDPQCKVVIRAQSALCEGTDLAVSGHALTFIPKE